MRGCFELALELALEDDYIYDGTLEGFLTVAVRCFRKHKMPHSIVPDYMVMGRAEENFYTNVLTSVKDSGHLLDLIGNIATPEVQQNVTDYFLTCSRNKELILFTYIYKALTVGAPIAEDYSDKTVLKIRRAVEDLYREAQSLLPAIDFYTRDNVSTAVIDPHNCVLPILKGPIFRREYLEDIALYDKRHFLLLRRSGEASEIVDVRKMLIPEIRNAEDVYTRIWLPAS